MLGKRILLLSEDQLLSGLVSKNLKKRGYDVKSASLANGLPCQWEEPGVGLLLLDVDPPGRDALEAVRALECMGWKGDIPVVTLCDEMPNEDRVADREGVQWVVKPFTVDALLSTVKQALGEAGASKDNTLYAMGVK